MVTAYESIKNKLSATEIYDIKQGGLIDAEIRAYAVALQVAYDKVDVFCVNVSFRQQRVTDLNSLNLWQEPI